MDLKKHLLPAVTQYFKANLHTHSNLSDGRLSPQQLKEEYRSRGYHILSITDHNFIANHSYLNESDFLTITGTEINLNHEDIRPGFDGKTYHLNLLAKRPDNLWVPCKATHRYPNALEYEKKMQCEDMDLSYAPETVNALIAKANEKGFLVMYNHPTWSCQSYPDYAPLKGLWGMELRNTGCCMEGNDVHNVQVYKDLLNLGNRLYPVGADDTHKPHHIGGAWVMVGARSLEYSSVMNALENGDFYMSCGPEIHSITVENNILKVTCSDARHIALTTHGRDARRVDATGEDWIREAEFDLTNFITKADGDSSTYIRLTVTAPDGTYAATRAYYLNEL